MKSTFIAFLLALAHIASGSQLALTTVVQPLYLHGSDTDPVISFQPVPFATSAADPEWRFSAISKPCVPATDGTWKPPHDVNLASIYGIRVSGGQLGEGPDVTVTIDASKAIQPEGYPFTIEQVIDAVTTCVKTMFPPRPIDEGKLEIKITRADEKTAPTRARRK